MVFNLMNQTCKVCGEPAAGFHFGAFTCEGCKSFFGRSYNNVSSISECKNNGKCVIDKKNRTTCKACRLRKCYTVGMSKGGSRYGRRSNWFKIHCLLQEQQQQAVEAAGKAAAAAAAVHGSVSPGGQPGSMNFGDLAAAAAAAAAAQQQQQQHSQHQQQHTQQHHHHQQHLAQSDHHRQHLAAAQQMGGLLAYSGSPVMTAEMMQSALPFFSLMSGSPAAGVPSAPGFPLPPPHLLFHPGYAAHPHHAAAAAAAAAHHHSAAAAAADAAYRAEMYKHRQSVDSAASAESLARSQGSVGHNAVAAPAKSTAEEVSDERSLSQHSVSPVSVASSVPQHLHPMQSVHHHHQIHSPIAIRATPATPPHHTASPVFMSVTPEPSVSFAVKMESLSPVSVCSISAETAAAAAPAPATLQQDSPIDLSMKASSRCSGSAASSGAESADEEPLTLNLQRQMSLRRKFYHLSSEHDSSDASCDADADRKRQKTHGQGNGTTSGEVPAGSSPATAAVSQGSPANGSGYSGNGFGAPPTSLRGIFVCV